MTAPTMAMVRVLAVEIGLRAFADGAGDLLHARVAGVGLHHRSDRVRRIGEREHAASDDPPQYFRHFVIPFGALDNLHAV